MLTVKHTEVSRTAEKIITTKVNIYYEINNETENLQLLYSSSGSQMILNYKNNFNNETSPSFRIDIKNDVMEAL